MPRYFFNVRNGRDTFDNEGVDLPGAREMHIHMFMKAAELIHNNPYHDENWQMEVLDETGLIIRTMDFGIEMEKLPQQQSAKRS